MRQDKKELKIKFLSFVKINYFEGEKIHSYVAISIDFIWSITRIFLLEYELNYRANQFFSRGP